MQETWVQSLGWKDPLEKETDTHSSILAWRIPWTEEPGRLQSTGSQSRTGLSNFHFSSPCCPALNLPLPRCSHFIFREIELKAYVLISEVTPEE